MIKNRKAAIGFIFITLLIDVTGLGLIIPVVPKLIEDLLHTTNISKVALFGGLLSFSYAIMQFLFAPVLGNLSDKFGRKVTMVITAILFILNSIGTAFPTSFTMFVLFRIVGGIGVGIASMVVPMYIAEIAPPKRRGALVGNYQLAIVIGIVVVYFVNYFIALQGDATWNLNIGWRWMFGSEIIPSLLFLIF